MAPMQILYIVFINNLVPDEFLSFHEIHTHTHLIISYLLQVIQFQVTLVYQQDYFNHRQQIQQARAFP